MLADFNVERHDGLLEFPRDLAVHLTYTNLTIG